MNLFDKKERNKLEGLLISTVRDYDVTAKMLDKLIEHGIDNPNYFRNAY